MLSTSLLIELILTKVQPGRWHYAWENTDGLRLCSGYVLAGDKEAAHKRAVDALVLNKAN